MKLLAVKFVLPLVCSLGVHAALLAVWAAPQASKRPAPARRPGVVRRHAAGRAAACKHGRERRAGGKSPGAAAR